MSDQDGRIVFSSVLTSTFVPFSFTGFFGVSQILILVNMPPKSASSLKKTNQELKAQINVLSGEIENLKSQLGVNADDESTVAAAATTTAAQQNVEDHRPSTNEHSDFQSVQTRAEAELKRLSARLAQVSAKVDEVGKAIDAIEEYSNQYNVKIVGVNCVLICLSKWAWISPFRI